MNSIIKIIYPDFKKVTGRENIAQKGHFIFYCIKTIIWEVEGYPQIGGKPEIAEPFLISLSLLRTWKNKQRQFDIMFSFRKKKKDKSIMHKERYLFVKINYLPTPPN